MDSTQVDVFSSATRSVFSTMLGCELTCREANAEVENLKKDVTGVIGISGPLTGSVMLSLTRDGAIGAAGALLGDPPGSIDADVIDSVGELTNMIAGQAKAKLSEGGLQLSLPAVVSGEQHDVIFSNRVRHPVSLTFDSTWGDVVVAFGFEEG